MKWKFLNIPLGAFAPYGNSNKQDALGVLDLIGGIFGSLMDSGNVAATNEANQWMNIATNRTNMEINQNNLDWAREQYEREKAENRFLVDQAYERSLADRDNERAYNSAKAQAERLLAAGINPALAMGSGALGHAGAGGSTVNSVGSPAHANQPQSIPAQSGIPMQAYTGFGQGIRDSMRVALESMAQQDSSAKIQSDITSNNVNNWVKLSESLAKINQMDIDNKYKSALTDSIKADLLLGRDTYESSVKLAKYNALLTEYRSMVEQTQVDLNKQALELNIDRNSREWQQLSGYLSSVASQNALNKIVGEKQYAETLGVHWDNVLKEFQNDPRRLQQIYTENRQYWNHLLAKMKFDRTYQGFTKFVETLSSVIPFAPGIKSMQNLPLGQ